MTIHLPSWNDIIDFLVLYVIVRGIIAKWLAKTITAGMKKVFVRSEQEVKLYMLYREKMARKE